MDTLCPPDSGPEGAGGTAGDKAHDIREVNKARTTRLREAVRAAMEMIEHECEAAGGAYPFNHGRLTQAEVCRRAGISLAALQGPLHRYTMRIEVIDWLKNLKSRVKQGRGARKVLTDQIAPLKRHIASLVAECTRKQLEISSLRTRVTGQQKEIDELRAMLPGARVGHASIPPVHKADPLRRLT